MRAALETLLSSNLAEAQAQAAEPFDHLLDRSGPTIVLVGAGEVGKNILGVLRQKGVEVACFADNNPLRWGATFEGLEILSPLAAARRHGQRALFVVAFKCPEAVYQKEEARLKRFGARSVCPMATVLAKWPEITGWPAEGPGFYLDRADRLREVFDLMEDEESKRQYLGHLRWRLARDHASLPTGELKNQYFCEDVVRMTDEECFLDGGAFDGDTLTMFLYDRCEAFRRVHAFEPDPRSFQGLRTFVGRLTPSIADKIAIYPHALSDREGIASFQALGNHSSTLGGGGASVRTVAIDELLGQERISFIKLDLEGGEMPAITGAEHTIRTQRPILTLAVYHYPADLIDIPLRIRELCPDYRFHLRTHNSFGLDVVLYAIPAERSL